MHRSAIQQGENANAAGCEWFLTSEKRVKTKANSMLQQDEFNVAVEFTDTRARNETWKMEMRGVKCHTGTQKIINYFAVRHELCIFAPFL